MQQDVTHFGVRLPIEKLRRLDVVGLGRLRIGAGPRPEMHLAGQPPVGGAAEDIEPGGFVLAVDARGEAGPGVVRPSQPGQAKGREELGPEVARPIAQRRVETAERLDPEVTRVQILARQVVVEWSCNFVCPPPRALPIGPGPVRQSGPGSPPASEVISTRGDRMQPGRLIEPAQASSGVASACESTSSSS